MAKSWFVVQTSPRHEAAVEKAIQGLDFRTLLPLCFWYRNHARRYERVSGPLFPCYLFAEFDPSQDAWVPIVRKHGQDGVRTILGMTENAGRPTPVHAGIIDDIRALLSAHHGEVRLEPERKQRFSRNDAVRILNGPFSGLAGIVVRDQRARVKCLLDLFGRQTEICFPRESIALAAAVA